MRIRSSGTCRLPLKYDTVANPAATMTDIAPNTTLICTGPQPNPSETAGAKPVSTLRISK